MENNNRMQDLTLQNCRIKYRNFEGRENQYNRQGDRSFSIVVEPENVDELSAAGWKIRTKMPREDSIDQEPMYLIDVRVNMDSKRPPRVFVIAGSRMTELDKDTVGTLDSAEILNVDVTISPHYWEVGSKSGVKAYLRAIYVTIPEDPLADKYSGFMMN